MTAVAAGDPVNDTLSKAEATAQCLSKGLVDNPLVNNDAFDECVANLMN